MQRTDFTVSPAAISCNRHRALFVLVSLCYHTVSTLLSSRHVSRSNSLEVTLCLVENVRLRRFSTNVSVTAGDTGALDANASC